MRRIQTASGKEIKDGTSLGTAEKRQISIDALAKGIQIFSSGHLDGLIELHTDASCKKPYNISIDPKYTALLFKELLMQIKGKEVLYALLKCDGTYAECDICFSTVSCIEDSDKSKLNTLAEQSGFEITFSDKITLRAKAYLIRFALVYAISPIKISKIFEYVMFS